jgi:hypothetical protein
MVQNVECAAAEGTAIMGRKCLFFYQLRDFRAVAYDLNRWSSEPKVVGSSPTGCTFPFVIDVCATFPRNVAQI